MKKLIVLSVDSLFTSDLEVAKTLPGFGEILKNSVIATDIECIYPTLTYPCHTSIITGEYPKKHQIIHNEKLDPSTNNIRWYWDYQDIQCKTIFDYAKEYGYTTAAINWPVTNQADIDYLVPEIWSLKECDDQQEMATHVSASVQHIYEKNKHFRNYREYPQLDEFAIACCEDIMKEYQPDVLFLHQTTLDHMRHVYGIHSLEAKEALLQHDEWIQRLIQCLKTQGVYEETTFVILGDHGQLNIQKNICLNTLFYRAGLLDCDETGTICDYRAYAQSAGISAHIYIKDESIQQQVLAMLKNCEQQGIIKSVFTQEECKENYQLDGPFCFVVEAQDGYAFQNLVKPEVLEEIDVTDYKSSVATHGHLPRRGDKPPFIVHKKDQKPEIVHGMRLVDEAATLLALLDIKGKIMEGKSIL